MFLKLAIGALCFVGIVVLVLLSIVQWVVVTRKSVIKVYLLKLESMSLAELSKIEFHYHAVGGFVCSWDFVAYSGRKMTAEANGIDDRLLSSLERNLPGFSKDGFYREFKDGDVVDTVDVWRAQKL